MKLLFLLVVFLSTQSLSGQGKKTHSFKPGGSNLSLVEQINKAKEIGLTDTAAADRLFRRAIQEAISKDFPYEAGLAYYELAEMNSRFNDHDRAFGGYFNARPFFEKWGAGKELAYTLFGLAREQYYRGGFNAAVNHFNYSAQLSRKYHLEQLEADALEYLALMHLEIPYFEKRATPDLFKSLSIKKKLNDFRGIVQLLQKISESYQVERKYDSALHYAQEAEQLSDQLKMPEASIFTRISKAAILILLQRSTEASLALDALKSEIYSTANPNLLLRYYITKANLLLSNGNEVAALVQYDSAMLLAKKRNMPDAVALVYRNKADAYARKHDFEKAYQFQKEYNNLFTKLYNPANANRYNNSSFLLGEKLAKDEVKYLANENQVKQLRLSSEIERRRGLQRENALIDSILQQQKNLSDVLTKAGDGLKRENKYKTTLLETEREIRAADTARLKEEKRVRVTLLTGLVTAIALGSVIFFQYQRQRKKNALIGKQANELQTLMKEIHHRVKNNLQIISSLLDLQALSIQDKEAAEAVKEGKNRVQSMALIHQNLYNDGNVRGIAMDNYITHLAQNLFDSYNVKAEKIKLITHIEPLNLDVDSVIPIGLVLNELISNSLKHAFTNRETGEIVIQLKKQQEGLFLQVKDNGNGFTNQPHLSLTSSFGMKLIKAFCQKLKAKLDMWNDNGACITIIIHRFKLAD
jgi:two-component system, sensor histidine kinase PdtaS